jgi:hypothetical protein
MARPTTHDKDPIFKAVLERDGKTCGLCGKLNERTANICLEKIEHQVDETRIKSLDPLSNLMLVCIPCKRRRDGKSIGEYLRSRVMECEREIAHISNFDKHRGLMRALQRPIVMGGASTVAVAVPEELMPTPKVPKCADMTDDQLYHMTIEEIDALIPEGDHERHENFRRHHMAKAGDALMRHYLLTKTEDGTIERVYLPERASHAHGTSETSETSETDKTPTPRTIEEAHAAARALLDKYDL